jgi:hypothetical protein
MTPTSPTWGDIATFLGIDGWTELPASARGGKRQRHIFFEKLLDDGRLLRTHISHDRASGAGAYAFALILKEQLEVGREEFWEAIRSGVPVSRPVPTDADHAVELPGWTIPVLESSLHMSQGEIARLSADEAIQRVQEYWARSS